MGEFVVSAGTAEKRMYWLQQLQKARREFSAGGAAAFKNSGNPHQVSKMKYYTQNTFFSLVCNSLENTILWFFPTFFP